MGNTKTKCFLPYSIFLDDEKPGETATLRHPIYANHPLQEVNQYGTRTTWECLNDKIKKGMGKKPLCGYRKRIEKDKYEEKFTWVSYEEALEKVIAFAKEIAKYNGIVTIHPRACSIVSADYPLLTKKSHLEMGLDEAVDIMHKSGC